MSMKTFLTEINSELYCNITDQGLQIEGTVGFSYENIDDICTKSPAHTPLGKQLLRWLPTFLSIGIAEIAPDQTLLITNEQFYHLLNPEEEHGEDFGFAQLLPSFSPFTLDLQNTLHLASPDLLFEYSFFIGPKQVFPTRIGCFLKTGKQLYILPQDIFNLLESIDEFNQLPTASKGKGQNLRHFSKIKLFCDPESVSMTKTMANETALIPEQFSIGLTVDSEGRISCVPQFEGVEEEVLKQAFYQHAEGQPFYDVKTSSGARIRLVINEELQTALTHMRENLTSISGPAKDQIMLNPLSAFEGICATDRISLDSFSREREHYNHSATEILQNTSKNLDGFGDRVIDIGPYIFHPIPRLKNENRPKFLNDESSDLYIDIDALTPSGNNINIPLNTVAKAENVLYDVIEGLKKGLVAIPIQGDNKETLFVPISEGLCDQLNRNINEWKERTANNISDLNANTPEPSTTATKKSSGDYFLHIAENSEDFLAYSESLGVHRSIELTYHPPKNLITTFKETPFQLKPYQQQGVSWLQGSFKTHRSGVLLADDMGLGKTLQVLTFLAWLIESGSPESFPDILERNSDDDPRRPILIVAPLILLENWKKEIEKFFDNNGSIFSPVAILNSKSIKQFIADPTIKGREYKIGRTVLDLEKLKRNRIIITNYDTLKNYQHSFETIKWSIVIADEAQELKNEKTAITHAMKGLASNARFKIAMSGTPIENGLMDLWCIMDFVCPGTLLGTDKEFAHQYEKKIINNEPGSAQALKDRLGMGELHRTFVLNRYKEDYLGSDELPTKEEIRLYYPVSERQWQLQAAIIKTAQQSEKLGASLIALHQLKKLYEHPLLLMNMDLDYSPQQLIDHSPKLQVVCEHLETIKEKGEKVLIFTRSLPMQNILKVVLAYKFGIKAAIINGSTKGNKRTNDEESDRFRLIREFEETAGFNALILSPDVAGVGLTIVEANHVIHYGRWWNPATEDQATCRAYRIGQTRPVKVYYPIGRAPDPTQETFEQKLDALLRQKSELRRDILTPIAALDVTSSLMSIFSKEVAPESGPHFTMNDLIQLDSQRFASFCAALMGKQGFNTILPPTMASRGIDALLYKGQQAQLLICKPFTANQGLSLDIAEEMKISLTYYRNRYLADLGLSIEMLLFTPLEIENGLKRSLSDAGIKIIDKHQIQAMLTSSDLTFQDILQKESERLDNMEDLALLLKTLHAPVGAL